MIEILIRYKRWNTSRSRRDARYCWFSGCLTRSLYGDDSATRSLRCACATQIITD